MTGISITPRTKNHRPSMTQVSDEIAARAARSSAGIWT
jgi:hypothetical protein